jgi:hypothetical protein
MYIYIYYVILFFIVTIPNHRPNSLSLFSVTVGFEILTAKTMKSTNCWDIMPCSVLEELVEVLKEHTASNFKVKE